MHDDVPHAPRRGLLSGVEIRPIAIDDLSNVRYVHAAAMRAHGPSHLAQEEIEAFGALVYTQSYADSLIRQRLTGAWLGSDLIGTGGWSVGDDSGSAVRVRSLFVRPFFSGEGVGRTLLQAVERQARIAGFNVLSVRSTLNAVAFFERQGYQITSHGTRILTGKLSLPVAFMRKTAGVEARSHAPAKQSLVH